MSIGDTRGSGLGQRGSRISQINGSGRMEAVLVLPSFVTESQTTPGEFRTVSTLAIAQEKPGMISPVTVVFIGYLSFARFQNEKNIVCY